MLINYRIKRTSRYLDAPNKNAPDPYSSTFPFSTFPFCRPQIAALNVRKESMLVSYSFFLRLKTKFGVAPFASFHVLHRIEYFPYFDAPSNVSRYVEKGARIRKCHLYDLEFFILMLLGGVVPSHFPKGKPISRARKLNERINFFS